MFVLKYFIGEPVYLKKEGFGTIINIDDTDKEYMYEIQFNNGTRRWGVFHQSEIVYKKFRASVEYKKKELHIIANCPSDLLVGITSKDAKELYNIFASKCETHLGYCNACNEEPSYCNE